MEAILLNTTLTVRQSTKKTLSSGDILIVSRSLGKGSQGLVYEVLDSRQNSYALKIYYPNTIKTDPEVSKRIENLVSIGSPNDNFLWCLDYLELTNDTDQYIGYIMPLRENGYYSPSSLLNNEVSLTFRNLLQSSLKLCRAFSALHLKGLCYKDVSLGNFFFNPDSGDCLVCDIDNICYDNTFDNTGGVLGTPRFMAPEIVEGQSRPSIASDSHSLAVLLFYMMFIGHPLEGTREASIRIFDVAAQKYLYGTSATYIFHPTDQTNRPDPTLHL